MLKMDGFQTLKELRTSLPYPLLCSVPGATIPIELKGWVWAPMITCRSPFNPVELVARIEAVKISVLGDFFRSGEYS